MVIGSSEVAMSSGRAYSRQARDRSSVSSWGEVLSATTTPAARESRTITQREETTQIVELYNSYNKNGRPVAENRAVMANEGLKKTQESVTVTASSEGANEKVKGAVGDALFVRVFASDNQTSGKRMTLQEFFSLLIHRRKEEFERFMENFRIGMQGGSVGSRVVTVAFEGDSTITRFFFVFVLAAAVAMTSLLFSVILCLHAGLLSPGKTVTLQNILHYI